MAQLPTYLFGLAALALGILGVVSIWRTGAKASVFFNERFRDFSLLYFVSMFALMLGERFIEGEPLRPLQALLVIALVGTIVLAIYAMGFFQGRLARKKAHGIVGMDD